jgi:hypothetical protein
MYIRLNGTHRVLPSILGVVTLASVGVLLAWDAFPRLFPVGAHNVLAAFPLASIAFAYIVYQNAHRPMRMEFLKAIMLAAAFLFWAANQLWPEYRQATQFNDVAIALFVLDVFLVIIGWPATSPDESFAESYAEPLQDDPNGFLETVSAAANVPVSRPRTSVEEPDSPRVCPDESGKTSQAG